ncbi:MAG TPA: helix-turn-helix domain-containing protein [Vicinamibacterales bacterium]|jgi:excisionase family DNA binding protein
MTSAPNATVWLTPKEAETYARCDVATLRRAVRANKLQAYRVNGGRRVRFRAVDLDRWLEAAPINEAAS